MCGIVGLAAIDPIRDRGWLVPARDSMAHRGPDDSGEWWSDDLRVGMGHRRLSIIDLSPLGHQPMHDADGSLTITFNGEIYNYRELKKELSAKGFAFRSESDTEVLLASYAEWGDGCLDHLNGMFAFAIHDARRQKVLLARDRAGEKPLFYRFNGQSLSFASELKALLHQPQAARRIDPEALDCYLAMGFIPGERCILQGYKKLPPAHALTFDLNSGKTHIWRYWSVPEVSPDPEKAVDETALLDELETLLEDAVGRQLVADVPVGVLLSGGVDSSLVTAMAVRHSRQVRTFSVGFPGQGKFDETPHARLIANHFGTRHTELMADPLTADLLPCLAQQFDEPMADSSMIPTFLVSRLVRQHCTVALGGDGGDELFGGYAEYSRLLWMQRWTAVVPPRAKRLLASGARDFLPLGFARSNVRTYLMALEDNLAKELPLLSSYFDSSTRTQLVQGQSPVAQRAETIRGQRVPRAFDLLQRATRMDFNNYLAEDILVKVDRASMLNSLEVRAPLLDYRVIEFAFRSVPSRLKATPREKKILLKRLAGRLFPLTFDQRRKQGFSIPIAKWLKSGPFRDLFWDILASPTSLFERQTVLRLLEGQDRTLSNGDRLFALLHFELWRRHYRTHL